MPSWKFKNGAHDHGQRGRIIENVVEIMKLLCNDDPKTIMEIAKATGLSYKTVWGYIQVFKAKMPVHKVEGKPARFWIG